jgi:hypothetical protein
MPVEELHESENRDNLSQRPEESFLEFAGYPGNIAERNEVGCHPFNRTIACDTNI